MSKSSDRGTARPKIQTPSDSKVARDKVGDLVVLECGCREQRFSDETFDRFPCVPHAFLQMAKSLIEAGNAIGYAGTALENQEIRNREMEKLNDLADEQAS